MINTFKRVALICCLLQPAALLAVEDGASTAANANLPCEGATEVDIAGKTLTVELANDQLTRSYGLRFREGLGYDCGMLYVFKNNQRRVFTMNHTEMPLDIAFITAGGVIAELATMTTGAVRYTSSSQAMYVLEVNAGWFEENNLQPGSQIGFKQGTALQPLASLND